MTRPSPDPYVHGVGFWQHILGDRLRVRIPFALCGMWLGGEPGVEYPGPDGPECPTCVSQVTVRQWFRLPKHERQHRIAEFKAADEALQINSSEEEQAGVQEETETFRILNGRVNDLWPTVPWWVRSSNTDARHVAARAPLAVFLPVLAAFVFCALASAFGWHSAVTGPAAVACTAGLIACAAWLTRSAGDSDEEDRS